MPQRATHRRQWKCLPVIALVALAVATANVDGVALSASATSSGDAASVELQLKDTEGLPLSRAEPLGWLLPDDPTTSCAGSIAKAMNATIASDAISLNSVRVFAAFADGSIGILDPQTSFAGTQLESALDFGMPIIAMATDPESGRVALALSDGSLRIVAPGVPAAAQTIAAPNTLGEVALAWSGSQLWRLDGNGLKEIGDDSRDSSLRTDHPVLIAGADGSLLAGGDTGQVLIVRDGNASSTANIAGLRGGAYAAKAKRWFAIAGDGRLLETGGGATRMIAGIADARAIAFDREGRFGIVIADGGKSLALVDSADGRVADIRPLETPATRLTMSDHFAYVHGAAAPNIDLVSLDVARSEGRLSSVTVPFGENGATQALKLDRVGIMPGGAIVAGNDGRTLYAYAEGMMVPMGTLGGAGRPLAGIAIIDRSLKETAPGIYRTVARVPFGGRYRLPVRMSNPRVDACVTLDLAGAQRPAPIARAKPVLDVGREAGAHAVSLTNAGTAPAILALATDTNGRWQRHVRLTRGPDGIHRGSIRFPGAGRFAVIAMDARAIVEVTQ
jgi:hypothetical protein